MKTTIVTTTINVPYLLDGYVRNFQAHGHTEVDFVVIGDRKTPPEAEPYLAALSAKGYSASYWGPQRQSEWLRCFPELDRLLPWNCVQRRNLGYLIAYQGGANLIITIDDDNFTTDDDYVGGHSIVGQIQVLPTVESSSGWFNACDLLEMERPRRIYHRGFPHSQRWKDTRLSYHDSEGRVVVNAGLWLGAPDVNAVTHLEEPCQVTALRPEVKKNIALAPGTCCPFNSQNTAFHRDLLPCMYLEVMGDEVLGQRIDRYDDIWMSYFAKKIIDHLGDRVAFGRPMVKQDRNPHDYVRDLCRELPGMILTEKLIVTLQELRLTEGSYMRCYPELAEALRHTICDSKDYSYAEKAYFLKLTDGMRVWADVCRQIQGSR